MINYLVVSTPNFSPVNWAKSTLKFLLSLVLALVIFSNSAALAADNDLSVGDLSRQPIAEIIVSLGNSDDELKFFPDSLEFQSGKRYKLVLTNVAVFMLLVVN